MDCWDRCQRGREGSSVGLEETNVVRIRSLASRVMKSVIFQPILGSCWLCLWALWLLGIGLVVLLLESFSLCSISPLEQSWVVPWSLLFSFILTYCSDHAVCVQASELNASHCVGVSKWTDQVTTWVSFLYCRNAPGSGSGHSSEALSHHQKCPGSLQWAGEWWLTCLLK